MSYCERLLIAFVATRDNNGEAYQCLVRMVCYELHLHGMAFITAGQKLLERHHIVY